MEKFQSELHKIESEKGELLADNQRMAELLAVSEGDSQVMEGLIEERRSLQRQCKQLRDNGESPYCTYMIYDYDYHIDVSEAVLTERVREMESHPSAAAAGGGVSEIRRVRKERDELKEAVRNFEAELTQIQLDTKMLAEDRDNFKLLYEQVEIIF